MEKKASIQSFLRALQESYKTPSAGGDLNKSFKELLDLLVTIRNRAEAGQPVIKTFEYLAQELDRFIGSASPAMAKGASYQLTKNLRNPIIENKGLSVFMARLVEGHYREYLSPRGNQTPGGILKKAMVLIRKEGFQFRPYSNKVWEILDEGEIIFRIGGLEKDLRGTVIKLAYKKPELREVLLPLVSDKAAAIYPSGDLPRAQQISLDRINDLHNEYMIENSRDSRVILQEAKNLAFKEGWKIKIYPSDKWEILDGNTLVKTIR